MLVKLINKNIDKIKKFYKNKLLPRVIYIPYFIAVPMFWFVHALGKFNKIYNNTSNIKKPMLCIEAGVRGWDIIEYKELYQSAIEYLGEKSVIKIEINQNLPYLLQIKNEIIKSKPTHYAYSPRTGGQNWITGLRDAVGVMLLLAWFRVVPIVFLTDLPIRLWRTQSAIVTIKKGLVVSLMAPNLVKSIFPHNRIIGPYLMPFSNNTLRSFEEIRKTNRYPRCLNTLFTGSLYEPRTTTLNLIKSGLEKRGFKFDIKGRELGGSRVIDEEYWWRLISAPIVVTTADQIPQNGADWPWLPHFVYRYSEVLACGTLLLAPEIPGVIRYFSPGVHYVVINGVDDAINKIIYYTLNEKERNDIASCGKSRMEELVKSNSFWIGIDIALGKDSIT
jgi:hypothetical protein